MAVPPYGTAIRDAIARGDLRDMKNLLAQAKQLVRVQGDLPKAIARLEKAIARVSKKRSTARRT